MVGYQQSLIPYPTDAACVDVPGGNAKAGQEVRLWQCNGLPNQEWLFKALSPSAQVVNPLSPTIYAIHYAANPNLCLDLPAGNSTNGNHLQLWNCNQQENQKWVYDGAADIHLLFGATTNTKCLDLTMGNTTNGAAIGIWDCESGDINQQWFFDGKLLS